MPASQVWPCVIGARRNAVSAVRIHAGDAAAAAAIVGLKKRHTQCQTRRKYLITNCDDLTFPCSIESLTYFDASIAEASHLAPEKDKGILETKTFVQAKEPRG